MRSSHILFAAALTVAAAPAALAAAPYEAGDFLVRVRVLDAMPDMGSKVNLGSQYHVTSSDFALPEIDFTYFLDPHWSLELIAGTSKHSLYLNKAVYLGSTWLLPPTLTAQYHFDQIGPFKPYVGAGINYSLFYDKRGTSALGKLKLTDQWGFALQAARIFRLRTMAAISSTSMRRRSSSRPMPRSRHRPRPPMSTSIRGYSAPAWASGSDNTQRQQSPAGGAAPAGLSVVSAQLAFISTDAPSPLAEGSGSATQVPPEQTMAFTVS
jgi:outer membrane protein